MAGNIFNSVIRPIKSPHSVYDLTRDIKGTYSFGGLYPFYLQEVIPGQKLKVSTSHLLRFDPLRAPIVHNVFGSIHYFFVPYRLLWDKSEKFFTGGKDGSFDTPMPMFTFGGVNPDGAPMNPIVEGSLLDHFGITPNCQRNGDLLPNFDLPPYNQSTTTINVMAMRAYDLIYRTHYADIDLQDTIGDLDPENGSPFRGNDVPTQLEIDMISQLRFRCYPKDYFTTIRPRAQRGTEVFIPSSREGQEWTGVDSSGSVSNGGGR